MEYDFALTSLVLVYASCNQWGQTAKMAYACRIMAYGACILPVSCDFLT